MLYSLYNNNNYTEHMYGNQYVIKLNRYVLVSSANVLFRHSKLTRCHPNVFLKNIGEIGRITVTE